MKFGLFCLSLLFTSVTFIVGVSLFMPGLKFDQGCGNYLKLAADANNIAIAKERLDVAIAYIESNNLTSGNSGVIFTYPENDLGIWYKNLKAAQKNLTEFPKEASETDVSTTLVKLRETLLDHGAHGDHVTIPDNIAYFPNQVLLNISVFVNVLMIIVAFFLWCAFFISLGE
jgi:hypothetical protein